MWQVLATRPKKGWLDQEQLPGCLILGGPNETFSEDQQDTFGVNADGDVKDEAKFKTVVANVCAERTCVTSDKLKIMTVHNMHEDQWLPEPQSIMHIKGFGSGLNGKAGKAVFKDISRSRCKMIMWDGDALDGTGFTNMVPKFLENDPQSKALVIKLDYKIDDFKESWEQVIEKYPNRIRVVVVDLKPPNWRDAADSGILEELKALQDLPEWAQEYFLLRRVACNATCSKKVCSLGVGGISKHEAMASANSGVVWTIYVLSRGRNEAHPTLADWAVENPSSAVKLRRHLDPGEALAFCKDENKPKLGLLLQVFLRLCPCCSRLCQ